MSQPTIVITQWVHPSVIASLQPHARLVLNQTGDTLPPAEVRVRCAEADGMIAFMSDRIDADFLASCPQLRIIAAALKGWDNIDRDACTRFCTWLSIVPDLLTVPTAELAIGLTLALARHIRAGDELVRSGTFDGWRPILYGIGLADTRIGIVGMGAVGRAIAERLQPFGSILAGCDPHCRREPLVEGLAMVALDELLAWARVVILAAPLTPESLRLIDARRLRVMGSDTLLVNIGRGAVVDEEAVAAALAARRLGGYAADVFACEDRSLPDAPAGIPAALLAQRDRTLFTPHLGSATDRAREAIALAAADNLIDFFTGAEPRDAINAVDVRCPG